VPTLLHIVNKSHTERNALASCLRLAKDGQALLLTEDGIYAATAANAAASGVTAAAGRLKVYALQPDVEARGMAGKLAAGVTPVDYNGFVDLVVEHSTSQSWL
jgi:tRNA 2-thiouridine synthesizing protein B